MAAEDMAAEDMAAEDMAATLRMFMAVTLWHMAERMSEYTAERVSEYTAECTSEYMRASAYAPELV